MAIKKGLLVYPAIAISALLFLSLSPSFVDAHFLARCGFDQIYQFGDSISDTGNLIREFRASIPLGRLPYGQTIHNATGRASDGLLIIDYIAISAGLPFLNPIKDTTANFKHGANFAVGGATAISSTVLSGKGITNSVTNTSLDIQLQWMENHFKSICGNYYDCSRKLENALFIVGEIGDNDYNFALLNNKTMEEVQALVPQVVDTIMDVVKRVIGFGARKIVVPGDFPSGCFPVYLSGFETDKAEDYDKNYCLKRFNSLTMYHNQLLQNAIHELQKENPKVKIIYGDYYNAYQKLLKVAAFRGFELQKACCGIGGKYNFNISRFCGSPGVPVCPDPSKFLIWDGIHLTQAAHRIITNFLLVEWLSKFHCFP